MTVRECERVRCEDGDRNKDRDGNVCGGRSLRRVGKVGGSGRESGLTRVPIERNGKVYCRSSDNPFADHTHHHGTRFTLQATAHVQGHWALTKLCQALFRLCWLQNKILGHTYTTTDESKSGTLSKLHACKGQCRTTTRRIELEGKKEITTALLLVLLLPPRLLLLLLLLAIKIDDRSQQKHKETTNTTS